MGVLKFDTKILVNVARLEIGQLFTKGTRRGHHCTLDTFLVSIKCPSLGNRILLMSDDLEILINVSEFLQIGFHYSC